MVTRCTRCRKRRQSVQWCKYQTRNDLLSQSVRFKSQTFRSLPKHQNPSAILKQWSAMRMKCSSACTLGYPSYPRAVLYSQASMRRNSLLYIHSVFLSMPSYGRVPLEQISRCFLAPHHQNPVYQVFFSADKSINSSSPCFCMSFLAFNNTDLGFHIQPVRI